MFISISLSDHRGSASVNGSEAGGEAPEEEVIYVKENVSVHPTEYIADRISGSLSLIKQRGSLSMSWIPYRVGNLCSQLSEKDRYLYMIRLLEFTEIRSIHQRTPALGWHYVVVLLSSGLAYPPLYFYKGGVNEFLDTIKQHVFLVRSGDDANVLIVNGFRDSLQLKKSVLVGGKPRGSPLAQKESISPYQAKRFTKFRERKRLIEIDTVTIDRSVSFYHGDDNPNVTSLHDILLTYTFYNFDLGYGQGMSDLLSPILYVMRGDSEAFWCFSALVERLGTNFDRSHSWVHSELFALSKLMEILDIELHNYFKQIGCSDYLFCFRWILTQFKREFNYEETMTLWEVVWTNHLSDHFHLYLCIVILKIIDEQMDSSTLLLFITKLSDHIDLKETLWGAKALCISAGEDGKAYIFPATTPSG
ncbi:hypothetical protein Droror1_Dr00011606 [Drosera rotundifolia]